MEMCGGWGLSGFELVVGKEGVDGRCKGSGLTVAESFVVLLYVG